MKEVRIFIASSKELVRERNYLAYLTIALSDDFERRGLRVRLSKWEYVDPTMTKERTEDRYIEEMLKSDAALVLFKNVLGKYTQEELKSAEEAEVAGNVRLKHHRVLFSNETDPSLNGDLTNWKRTLRPGSYGEFSGFDDLRREFLALIDSVGTKDLAECDADPAERQVTAFLAADDELAIDRDAFADMILNLNDVLTKRGIRIRLLFYNAEKHRDILDASDMALVLYNTGCKTFGPAQMSDAYDRTKRMENPKRLYVFFRDSDNKPLDAGFADFRDGFSENLGHFFCRFENVDTLKLNFLLSLENMIGDSAGSFVRLEDKTVKAGDLEVAEITKLPSVANNSGLNDLLAKVTELSRRFKDQQEKCRKSPEDDLLYDGLLAISEEKNRIQSQIDKELSMALNLAKRMATISITETNENILRARNLMDEGRIKEAIDLLDGASSSLRRRRVLKRAEERADEEGEEIREIIAGNEVEFFRAEAVLAYTEMPFEERLEKAKSIYRCLVEDIEGYAASCSVRHKDEVDGMLADILRRYAKVNMDASDSIASIPLLERSVVLYKEIGQRGNCTYAFKRFVAELNMARQYELNNSSREAEARYVGSLKELQEDQSLKELQKDDLAARAHGGLGRIYFFQHNLRAAESEFGATLELARKLALTSPEKYSDAVADSLNGLASVHHHMNQIDLATNEYEECVRIVRDQKPGAAENKDNLAGYLSNFAVLLRDQKRYDECERVLGESMALRRELVTLNPMKYGKDLADVLVDFSILYNAKDECGRAAECLTEALEILRPLSRRNWDRYVGDLTTVTFNLAFIHNKLKDYAGAERGFDEAIAIARKASGSNPARFTSLFAFALCGAGRFKTGRGSLTEAEQLLDEGLKLNRSLAEQSPEKFEPEVSFTLRALADAHMRLEKLADAEREAEESLSISRRLVKLNTERYEDDLLGVLDILGDISVKLGKHKEAVAYYSEALKMHGEDSAKIEEKLARARDKMGA